MLKPLGGGDLARIAEAYAQLRLAAETYTDLEKALFSVQNRYRSGSIRPSDQAGVIDGIDTAKKAARRNMIVAFRSTDTDLYAWAKAVPGVGEHTMARLLGAIGHPVVAFPMRWTAEPPADHECDKAHCKTADGTPRHLVADPVFYRNVAKLWSYCGYGDPGRKRRKGMTADDAMALGKPDAKKILFTAAEAAVKFTCPEHRARRKQAAADLAAAGDKATPGWAPPPDDCTCPSVSPYRAMYDDRRMQTMDRGWTAAHCKQDAYRIVIKDGLLKDLWIVARASLLQADAQSTNADPSDDQ